MPLKSFMLGVLVGTTFGTLLVGFGIWEAALKTGEAIAWHKVPDGVRTCKAMLDRHGLNDTQEGYCAELLARALGEIE